MSKATMLSVGMLMIALVVGLGASAEAPVEEGRPFAEEPPIPEEPCESPCEPLWDREWNVVNSRGGLITDPSGCECPIPDNEACGQFK